MIDVHIGQVKIAKEGEILRALLGSCVGLGVIWKEREICGLAHCLLPKEQNPTLEIGAKFVDQAFRSLIALMKIGTKDLGSVSVLIVGGGNMTKPNITRTSELVGLINFNMAINEAKRLNLKVIYTEGGGVEGRKIMIDSSTFSFRIEKIPRLQSAA